MHWYVIFLRTLLDIYFRVKQIRVQASRIAHVLLGSLLGLPFSYGHHRAWLAPQDCTARSKHNAPLIKRLVIHCSFVLMWRNLVLCMVRLWGRVRMS